MPTRLPQLDGLRGVAILLVILHNQSPMYPSLHLENLFANGWMGVDLFFVLSGFLITGILVDTKHSEGYLKNFYARRCLRIWPLYYALLFFMFIVVPFMHPSMGQTVFDRSSPWWAYPLFLQNFLVPARGAGPLNVTWSLAIEEQFYLLWPWVVRYCSSAQVRRIAIAVMCVSPVLRLLLSFGQVDLYRNVFCRLDGLMAGALLALLVRSDSFVPARYIKRAWIVFLVAVPLAFVTEALDVWWLVFSLTALASAALVYLSLYAEQAGLQRALTNRFMVYTGTISYGLYLLHKSPFDIAKALQLDRFPLLAAPMLLVACYGVAVASWNLLEKPCLRLKRHFESQAVSPALRPGRLIARGVNR